MKKAILIGLAASVIGCYGRSEVDLSNNPSKLEILSTGQVNGHYATMEKFTNKYWSDCSLTISETVESGKTMFWDSNCTGSLTQVSLYDKAMEMPSVGFAVGDVGAETWKKLQEIYSAGFNGKLPEFRTSEETQAPNVAEITKRLSLNQQLEEN